MLVFLDTEFSSFESLSHISIGLCDERGQNCCYVESDDIDISMVSDFVLSEVLPQMGTSYCREAQCGDESFIKRVLLSYFKKLTDQHKQVTLVCDYSGDITVLTKALGIKSLEDINVRWKYINDVLPQKIHALTTYAQAKEIRLSKPWPKYPSLQPHHALFDARALALAYSDTWLDASY